jgi:hypothetical protein
MEKNFFAKPSRPPSVSASYMTRLLVRYQESSHWGGAWSIRSHSSVVLQKRIPQSTTGAECRMGIE